jgi:hypothetical protein
MRFAFAALFLLGCPPAAPASTPDASPDASPTFDAATVPDAPAPSPAMALCQTVCGRMSASGCREGSVPDCAKVLCAVNADPHFKHYNMPCIATAADASAIRACGGDCTP